MVSRRDESLISKPFGIYSCSNNPTQSFSRVWIMLESIGGVGCMHQQGESLSSWFGKNKALIVEEPHLIRALEAQCLTAWCSWNFRDGSNILKIWKTTYRSISFGIRYNKRDSYVVRFWLWKAFNHRMLKSCGEGVITKESIKSFPLLSIYISIIVPSVLVPHIAHVKKWWIIHSRLKIRDQIIICVARARFLMMSENRIQIASN